MDVDIIVTVCLSSFCYWWLIPQLRATTKEFSNQLNAPHILKSLRIAHAVKRVSIKFAMIRETHRLRARLAKHIWMLWRNTDAPTSLLLADAVHAFQAGNTPTTTTTIEQAKLFGLHERYWGAALHILVRLAVWMRYFQLHNTHLHTVFMARMDVLFAKLNKSHTMRKKRLFSHYIEAICFSQHYEAWVWSPTMSVITTPTYTEMQQVWWYGKRGTHFDAISHLPGCLQAALGLVAILFRSATAKTHASKRKLANCVAVYTDKL